MIFVDTGAWFAAITPSDKNHAVTKEWLANNRQPLFTTDYVVDETLTLLRMRGERQRALEIGESFFSGTLAELYFLTEEDVFRAWRIFRDYDDKGWSFTDCASKYVMEKLGMTHAFAFDHHFHQFGDVIVVP